MNIEMLEFDEELEVIEKLHNGFLGKFGYPVVCFKNTFCCFNSECAPLVPENIKWAVSTNYVVGLPGKNEEKNTFRTRKRFDVTCAFFPSVLKNEKKLQDGYYKIYKYKDGFAFKRYEQLEEP